MDNIDRIAEPDFLPTNGSFDAAFFTSVLSHVLTIHKTLDDILNVRLQTLGVMEHTFPINMGGVTYDWKLYDVGGAVTLFSFGFVD